MLDGTTRCFLSDEIEFVEYLSVSRNKKNQLQSVPSLLISVRNEKILFHGKRLIKKFLGEILEGFAALPDKLKNHLMAENEWMAGEDVPRFIDEIASINTTSTPVMVSVVGHTTPTNFNAVGTVKDAFMVNAIHARNANQDFNINYVSDVLPLEFEYGYTTWKGAKKNKTVPIAHAELDFMIPASIVVYDFGRSFGIVSRLNIGVRPHRIMEIKRREGEVERLIHGMREAVVITNRMAHQKFSNIPFVDFTGMKSLEIDEMEYTMGITLKGSRI